MLLLFAIMNDNLFENKLVIRFTVRLIRERLSNFV